MMIKLSRIHLVLLSLWLVPATIAAQAKTKPPVVVKDTSILPGDKIIQAQSEAESYLRMAASTKNKLKALFPSKPGDTVYVMVSGIDYSDPNLKLLKDNIEDIKNSKGITAAYKSGTVVVKTVYKGGNASVLYDKLGDAVKELFMAEEIDGNHMVLTYKLSHIVATPKQD